MEMKTGVKLLLSTSLLLSLVSCGDAEEVITYEDSPIEVPLEYVLSEKDTAPAFYADMFAYAEANVVPEPEAADPDAAAVELTKEQEAEKKEEDARLAAANELLQKELDAENNQIRSIQLVKAYDPTEANAAAIDEATQEHEAQLAAAAEVSPAPDPEGTVEAPLSNETELEDGAEVATPAVTTTPVDDDSYLDDVTQEAFVYTYDISSTGKSGGQVTGSYIDYMTSSGFKIIDSFHPVNDEYYEMLTPDFTQRAGTVSIAKKASGTDRLFLIVVDWNYHGAVVTVDFRDGTLWVAPKVDSAASKGALSISDAVNYLQTRNPTDLGLSGVSMNDYNVYTSEGVVMINGVSYREFTVTGKATETNGNTYGGRYLISAEGNVFTVDHTTGTAFPLNITNVYDTLG